MPRGIFKPIGVIVITKIATLFSEENETKAEFDLGVRL